VSAKRFLFALVAGIAVTLASHAAYDAGVGGHATQAQQACASNLDAC
jgi:hypothetical protein